MSFYVIFVFLYLCVYFLTIPSGLLSPKLLRINKVPKHSLVNQSMRNVLCVGCTPRALVVGFKYPSTHRCPSCSKCVHFNLFQTVCYLPFIEQYYNIFYTIVLSMVVGLVKLVIVLLPLGVMGRGWGIVIFLAI